MLKHGSSPQHLNRRILIRYGNSIFHLCASNWSLLALRGLRGMPPIWSLSDQSGQTRASTASGPKPKGRRCPRLTNRSRLDNIGPKPRSPREGRPCRRPWPGRSPRRSAKRARAPTRCRSASFTSATRSCSAPTRCGPISSACARRSRCTGVPPARSATTGRSPSTTTSCRSRATLRSSPRTCGSAASCCATSMPATNGRASSPWTSRATPSSAAPCSRCSRRPSWSGWPR